VTYNTSDKLESKPVAVKTKNMIVEKVFGAIK